MQRYWQNQWSSITMLEFEIMLFCCTLFVLFVAQLKGFYTARRRLHLSSSIQISLTMMSQSFHTYERNWDKDSKREVSPCPSLATRNICWRKLMLDKSSQCLLTFFNHEASSYLGIEGHFLTSPQKQETEGGSRKMQTISETNKQINGNLIGREINNLWTCICVTWWGWFSQIKIL